MRSLVPSVLSYYRQLILLICVQYGSTADAELLPLDIETGRQALVTCLESPTVRYNLYLPSEYSVDGDAMPILYTHHADGGGMVGEFREVCEKLGIIVVGVRGSSNSASWSTVLKEFFAVSRDVRLRILFDPTAEMVGGFSGGGENSYVFSRFRSQHVSGVVPIGGWLGRNRTDSYQTTDRVREGLLVARITGLTDAGARQFRVPDGEFLTSSGARINDFDISGGHMSEVPEETKEEALTWILSNRRVAETNERVQAEESARQWSARIQAGELESVLRECVETLMGQPRSWHAYHAQLIVDQLMGEYESFRALNLEQLAQGDFALDYFYYYARGAAFARDQVRYYSALKALTGISGDNGERRGDLRSLLRLRGYPSPVSSLQIDHEQDQIILTIPKVSRGLELGIEITEALGGEGWNPITAEIQETDAYWRIEDRFRRGRNGTYYGFSFSIVPGTSPPWPR